MIAWRIFIVCWFVVGIVWGCGPYKRKGFKARVLANQKVASRGKR